jgi:hypothetical protein
MHLRQQQMAAQLEKIVPNSDGLDPEQFLPDLCDGEFGGIARSASL